MDALAVSPDGKTLYAGGSFGAVNGVGVSSLAAIDIATCTVQTSFRPVGAGAGARVGRRRDDTVYFGGDFTTVAGQTRGTVRGREHRGRAAAVEPERRRARPGRRGARPAASTRRDRRRLLHGRGGTGLARPGRRRRRRPEGWSEALPAGSSSATSVVKDIASDATGFYTGQRGHRRRRVRRPHRDRPGRLSTSAGGTPAWARRRPCGLPARCSTAARTRTTARRMGEFPDGRAAAPAGRVRRRPEAAGLVPRHRRRPLRRADRPARHDRSPPPADTTTCGWAASSPGPPTARPQQGLTRFADGPDTGTPVRAGHGDALPHLHRQGAGQLAGRPGPGRPRP